LLHALGVLLGIAWAAFEQTEVAGEPDVVAGLAVALAGQGIADAVTVAGGVVGVG
jgi:hypothetical protein